MTGLAARLAKTRKALGLTQAQASVEAMVGIQTIRHAEEGRPLRNLTVQRLEAWLVQAEERQRKKVQRS